MIFATYLGILIAVSRYLVCNLQKQLVYIYPCVHVIRYELIDLCYTCEKVAAQPYHNLVVFSQLHCKLVTTCMIVIKLHCKNCGVICTLNEKHTIGVILHMLSTPYLVYYVISFHNTLSVCETLVRSSIHLNEEVGYKRERYSPDFHDFLALGTA